MANGWNPVGLSADQMRPMISQLKEMAKAAGRDPGQTEVIVRGNLLITPKPLGQDRWILTGTLDQIKTDIEQIRDLGVNELFFDPTFSPDGETAEAFLGCMERIRQLV